MKKQDIRHWEIQISLWIIIMILLMICHRVNAQNLDIHILRQINTSHTLTADGFFRVVSNSDIAMVAAVPLTMMIVGVANRDVKLIDNSGLLIVSTVITFCITDVVKYKVNRQRPFVTYKDILNKSKVYSLDPSFPSGHTSIAFNLATSLSLDYPKWYIILPVFTYAGTVAYSRMYLGVHYPSDILVGALIGSGTAYLTHVVCKRLNRY
jgi:membrane-associated phospholipid phosphatase